MKKLVYSTLMLLLAAGGTCLAQSGPSLGELAKQHRDEKKAAKVFTNEDIATAHPSDAANEPPQHASAPAPSSSSAAPGEGKTADKKKESSGKETTAASKDSPEVAELKQKISSYKQEQEGWKKSAKRYQDLLATETSDFRRQMYQDALQGDQNNIQLFQTKIDEAQTDLAKAEKSAQSGGH